MFRKRNDLQRKTQFFRRCLMVTHGGSIVKKIAVVSGLFVIAAMILLSVTVSGNYSTSNSAVDGILAGTFVADGSPWPPFSPSVVADGSPRPPMPPQSA